MDLARTTALLYAEDMMTFVMRAHKVQWRATIETNSALTKEVKVRFHPDVGSIMLINAKTIWRKELGEITPQVLEYVKSPENFIKHSRLHARSLFDRVGFNPFSVLKVFAFMTEFSVLYYKRNAVLADAPETAVKFISDMLESPEGLAVLNSRLNALNEAAKNMLREKLKNIGQIKNSAKSSPRRVNASQSNSGLSQLLGPSNSCSPRLAYSLISATNSSG